MNKYRTPIGGISVDDEKVIHRGDELASGGLASSFLFGPAFQASLWTRPLQRSELVIEPFGEQPADEVRDSDWLQAARSQLVSFSKLETNWDGRGSEAPNPQAIRQSEQVLLAFHQQGVKPSRIAASSSDGVIFYLFGDEGRRGDIEVANSGELVATIRAHASQPAEVFEVAAEDVEIEEAIERILAALNSRFD